MRSLSTRCTRGSRMVSVGPEARSLTESLSAPSRSRDSVFVPASPYPPVFRVFSSPAGLPAGSRPDSASSSSSSSSSFLLPSFLSPPLASPVSSSSSRAPSSGAVHTVAGSPSTAACAVPRGSVTSDGPSATTDPGSCRSARKPSPGVGMRVTAGETAVSDGTDRARVNTPRVSGGRLKPEAHLNNSSLELVSRTHADRPVSSCVRTHCATSGPFRNSGSVTRCRIDNGVPVDRSVSATSAIANWLPALPVAVCEARISIHEVDPPGRVTVNGFPGEIPWATELPVFVVTTTVSTSGPIARAVVSVSDRPVRGRVKLSRNHFPAAAAKPPDTQAVPGFPSNAAAVELVGEVCPGCVASAAEPELDTLTCPGRLSSSHCARTRSSASMPSQAG